MFAHLELEYNASHQPNNLVGNGKIQLSEIVPPKL